MIKAVLLDLDDTLLINPTPRFIESYLGLLNQSLSAALGLPEIMRPLINATGEVGRSTDLTRTNAEVFYGALRPLLAVEQDRFDPAVSHFYRQVYPQLRAYTTRRDGSRTLVDWLIAQGKAVVVATNPYFPRVAVEQRLAWAGLPVDEVPFALVTTLEGMHACKPHPEYYEEILARIGVPAGEALMVGDDWALDIAPAQRAGLNTFWVMIEGGDPLPADALPPDGCGSFEEFARRVQHEGWLDTLHPRPLEPAQIIPRLAGGAAALLGVIRETAAAGAEAPLETVRALAEEERSVQRPRIEAVLRGDAPHSAAPAVSFGRAGELWPAALEFAAERRRTLDLLAGLDPAAWTPALLAEAERIAAHDRAQIARLRGAGRNH